MTIQIAQTAAFSLGTPGISLHQAGTLGQAGSILSVDSFTRNPTAPIDLHSTGVAAVDLWRNRRDELFEHARLTGHFQPMMHTPENRVCFAAQGDRYDALTGGPVVIVRFKTWDLSDPKSRMEYLIRRGLFQNVLAAAFAIVDKDTPIVIKDDHLLVGVRDRSKLPHCSSLVHSVSEFVSAGLGEAVHTDIQVPGEKGKERSGREEDRDVLRYVLLAFRKRGLLTLNDPLTAAENAIAAHYFMIGLTHVMSHLNELGSADARALDSKNLRRTVEKAISRFRRKDPRTFQNIATILAALKLKPRPLMADVLIAFLDSLVQG